MTDPEYTVEPNKFLEGAWTVSATEIASDGTDYRMWAVDTNVEAAKRRVAAYLKHWDEKEGRAPARPGSAFSVE